LIDTNSLDCQTIGRFFGINGQKLLRQYKNFMSDYDSWPQKPHASEWLLFEENLGKRLSIDEVALSRGELYTVITNKAAKGRKGSVVAVIEGTKSEKVIEYLQKIPASKRNKVEEISLDMAFSMKAIATWAFPKAIQVTDRFHVQQLCSEAVQELRIRHRWEVIEEENNAIKAAKQAGKKYVEKLLENGDTKRQLLARSRYFLYKSRDKWTDRQKERASILFELYPDIQKAYNLCQQLRAIYNGQYSKEIAMTKLAHWYKEVDEAGFNSFNSIKNTIQLNYTTILNYFNNRTTNAAAESFNAKIKAFRAQFRGVRSATFFLYRLSQIYA
jgi:transposase